MKLVFKKRLHRNCVFIFIFIGNIKVIAEPNCFKNAASFNYKNLSQRNNFYGKANSIFPVWNQPAIVRHCLVSCTDVHIQETAIPILWPPVTNCAQLFHAKKMGQWVLLGLMAFFGSSLSTGIFGKKKSVGRQPLVYLMQGIPKFVFQFIDNWLFTTQVQKH